MTKNTKQTSKKVASQAGKILQDKKSSAIQKTLAAGALSQTKSSNQTGKGMEAIASKVLKSDKYNATSKTLAGSIVAQSNKNR